MSVEWLDGGSITPCNMSATSPKPSKLTLKPMGDGEPLLVDRDIAEKSQLIKNMLEDIGEEASTIPLPNVSQPILQKVIDYCTHHRHDPPLPPEDEASPYRSKNSYDIDEW
eukprot:NODE_803_length_3808_cov_1.057381.p4 type:complete len:111 gc:universal NODE_803_length_3808_cov_1.057381:3615-3283(-)